MNFDPTEAKGDNFFQNHIIRNYSKSETGFIAIEKKNGFFHYLGKLFRWIRYPSTHMGSVYRRVYEKGTETINAPNFETKLIKLNNLQKNMQQFEVSVIDLHNKRRFSLFRFFRLAGIRIEQKEQWHANIVEAFNNCVQSNKNVKKEEISPAVALDRITHFKDSLAAIDEMKVRNPEQINPIARTDYAHIVGVLLDNYKDALDREELPPEVLLSHALNARSSLLSIFQCKNMIELPDHVRGKFEDIDKITDSLTQFEEKIVGIINALKNNNLLNDGMLDGLPPQFKLLYFQSLSQNEAPVSVAGKYIWNQDHQNSDKRQEIEANKIEYQRIQKDMFYIANVAAPGSGEDIQKTLSLIVSAQRLGVNPIDIEFCPISFDDLTEQFVRIPINGKYHYYEPNAMTEYVASKIKAELDNRKEDEIINRENVEQILNRIPCPYNNRLHLTLDPHCPLMKKVDLLRTLANDPSMIYTIDGISQVNPEIVRFVNEWRDFFNVVAV